MNEKPTLFPSADLAAWDEAFRRVESYLRAHGVESRVQLNSLATDIIASAQRAAAGGLADPVTVAMQQANARIDAWLARTLDIAPSGDERARVRGRLALIMADLPGRWPQYFLSDEPAPAELVAAMKSSGVQAGPEVRFTNMAPHPLEFGPAPGIGNAASGLNRATLLRAAALWVVIVGLLGATWAASH